MENCDALCNEGIYQGSEYCCDKPPQGGVSDRLILFNWDNLESVTKDADGVITNITLKAGTKTYAFIGNNGSNQPSAVFIAGGITPKYDHQVLFTAFDTDQKAKTNYETFAQKPVIAIIEKTKGKTQGGDDSFEVLGLGIGMLTADIQYLPADAETGGTYTITLKTSDTKSKESKLPVSFFDTDYATTLAKLNNSLNLPAVYNVDPTALAIAGGDTVSINGTGFFQDGVADVTAIDFVDSQGVVTSQTPFTVSSNTEITFTSVSLIAETYSIRVTTSNGIAQSKEIIVAS